jgi:hypothetical protein
VKKRSVTTKVATDIMSVTIMTTNDEMV